MCILACHGDKSWRHQSGSFSVPLSPVLWISSFFLFLGEIDAIREIGLGCPGIGESLALGPLAQLLEPKASVFHFQLIVINYQVEMLFQ